MYILKLNINMLKIVLKVIIYCINLQDDPRYRWKKGYFFKT